MTTLAPFNPTGAGAIDVALRLLAPTKDDVVYDIGCGDGRLLVAIAKQCGSRCVGLECDASLVQRAHALIHEHDVSDRVTIRQEDATTSDFSDATLIFLYLVPKGILAMLPMLEAAKANGVRICTNIFSIPSWQPTATGDYKGTKIYLYA